MKSPLIRGKIYSIWEFLFVFTVLLITGREFIGFPARIASGSMEPTLKAVHIHFESLAYRIIPKHLIYQLIEWILHGKASICVAKSLSEKIYVVKPLSFMTYLLGAVVVEVREENGNRLRYFVPIALWNRLRDLKLNFRKNDFIYQNSYMYFEMQSADWVWVDRLVFRFLQLKRFDIVAFRLRNNNPWHSISIYPYLLVKRLIGLPGEYITINQEGMLIVNGFLVKWPEPLEKNKDFCGYLTQQSLTDRQLPPISPIFPSAYVTYYIRPEHVLVFGDNSLGSIDSRLWGAIPVSCIIGRVSFRIWPW